MLMFLVAGYLVFIYPFFKKIKNKKILIILAIIPIFLSLAFQIGIGTDYYNYVKIFYNKMFFSYSRGPIFKIIVIYLRNMFNSERVMFLFIAFIQAFLYYKIILKFYKTKLINNIIIFIIITMLSNGMYVQMFNILRNSIASLFVNLAVFYLLNNNVKKNFLLIILGSGFHPSVFIWNILFFIKNYFYKKQKSIRIIVFIIGCFILNKLNFIRNIARLIYFSEIPFPYRHFLLSAHMFPYQKTYGTTAIVLIIFCILALRFYLKEENRNIIFIYNLGYFSFGLKFLFEGIPIFNRLLGPFLLFQSYILYKLTEKTLNKRYFYFGLIVILFSLLFFIRASLLMLKFNNYNCMILK